MAYNLWKFGERKKDPGLLDSSIALYRRIMADEFPKMFVGNSFREGTWQFIGDALLPRGEFDPASPFR